MPAPISARNIPVPGAWLPSGYKLTSLTGRITAAGLWQSDAAIYSVLLENLLRTSPVQETVEPYCFRMNPGLSDLLRCIQLQHIAHTYELRDARKGT